MTPVQDAGRRELLRVLAEQLVDEFLAEQHAPVDQVARPPAEVENAAA
jgi:hypothetical protein